MSEKNKIQSKRKSKKDRKTDEEVIGDYKKSAFN